MKMATEEGSEKQEDSGKISRWTWTEVEEMISTPENPTELSTTEVQSSLGVEDMTMKMID